MTYFSLTDKKRSLTLFALGAAYCWGNGASGRLGNGDTADVNFAAPIFGNSFSSIVAGGTHTCGLTFSGAAYCWGNATSGKLGNGQATTNASSPVVVSGGLTFSSISVGFSHACGLTSNGKAYCWGYNDYGQIGNYFSNPSVPRAVISTDYSL